MSDVFNDDIVTACADLVGRAGAEGFELGYLHDDVPIEQAGWYASAMWRGTRLMAEDKASPTEAALGLAQRILSGAICRCGNPVSLSDQVTGCRWRLIGPRWEPGCKAKPIVVKGARRGDTTAIGKAMMAALDRKNRRTDGP